MEGCAFCHGLVMFSNPGAAAPIFEGVGGGKGMRASPGEWEEQLGKKWIPGSGKEFWLPVEADLMEWRVWGTGAVEQS